MAFNHFVGEREQYPNPNYTGHIRTGPHTGKANLYTNLVRGNTSTTYQYSTGPCIRPALYLVSLRDGSCYDYSMKVYLILAKLFSK